MIRQMINPLNVSSPQQDSLHRYIRQELQEDLDTFEHTQQKSINDVVLLALSDIRNSGNFIPTDIPDRYFLRVEKRLDSAKSMEDFTGKWAE